MLQSNRLLLANGGFDPGALAPDGSGYVLGSYTRGAVPGILIVSDKSTEVVRAWDSGGVATGAFTSRSDGSIATESAAADSTFLQALNYCKNLSSGGKTDWYLGGIDEYRTAFAARNALPVGQQFATIQFIWSATEVDLFNALAIDFAAGAVNEASVANSTSNFYVRAIRFVPI